MRRSSFQTVKTHFPHPFPSQMSNLNQKPQLLLPDVVLRTISHFCHPQTALNLRFACRHHQSSISKLDTDEADFSHRYLQNPGDCFIWASRYHTPTTLHRILSLEESYDIDDWGILGLRAAAETNNIPTAKYFLQVGTNLCQYYDTAETENPLYVAVFNGHLEMTKLLYEAGAPIIDSGPLINPHPVHFAAEGGFADIVLYLLRNRDNLEFMIAEALYGAMFGGQADIVELIFRARGEVELAWMVRMCRDWMKNRVMPSRNEFCIRMDVFLDRMQGQIGSAGELAAYDET